MRVAFVLFILMLCSALHAEEIAKTQASEVGVVLALTGGLATMGDAMVNGINLAEKDHPGKFRDIKFIYEDYQQDPKRAVTAYQSLKSRSNVKVIFVFGSVAGYALADLAEKQSVPVIYLGFEATPAIDKQFMVRSMNHSAEYQEALLGHLRSKGVSSFEIIKTEVPFIESMVSELKALLNNNESLKVVHSVKPSDHDFRSFISKIRKTDTKWLGLFLLPGQIKEFLLQSKQLNAEFNVYGTDLFETASKLAGYSGLLDGALYPDNNYTKEFAADYIKNFGNHDHLTFAASIYDMAVLTAEAINNNNLERSNFLDSIRALQSGEGVLGEWNFTKSKKFGDYFKYPVVVKVMKSGVGVPVEALS